MFVGVEEASVSIRGEGGVKASPVSHSSPPSLPHSLPTNGTDHATSFLLIVLLSRLFGGPFIAPPRLALPRPASPRTRQEAQGRVSGIWASFFYLKKNGGRALLIRLGRVCFSPPSPTHAVPLALPSAPRVPSPPPTVILSAKQENYVILRQEHLFSDFDMRAAARQPNAATD